MVCHFSFGYRADARIALLAQMLKIRFVAFGMSFYVWVPDASRSVPEQPKHRDLVFGPAATVALALGRSATHWEPFGALRDAAGTR